MRCLGLLLAAALLTACSHPAEPPRSAGTATPTPTETPTRTPAPRPALADLPLGAPPRIGYVDDQAYVGPGGRRTALPPRLGVSGIVPYAGGFLLADTRYFEGTVGLSLVRDGRVVDGWCSTGVPTRADGWVTWLVAYCPESADLVRAAVHRARPDGSGETVRRIAPRSVPRVAASPTSTPIPELPRRWYAAATAREDRRRVLAVVVQGRWIAIVRFGPRDVIELATPAVRHDPNLPAYALGPGR